MLKQKNDPPKGTQNPQNHKLRKRIIIVVAVTVVGGIAWANFRGKGELEESEPLFTVKRGDLRISAVMPGTVQAHKSVTVTSEVEGETTIISIIPEGSYVNEGDVLVELESSLHREEIDKHQIRVSEAEAAMKNAEEAYEIQKNQNESDITAAELAVMLAKIDLDKYTGGDWEQAKRKADNGIVKAQAAFEIAKRKLDGTRTLFEREYVTELEVRFDELSYDLAEIALNQAKETRRLLEEYDYPKQLQRFTADYEEAQKALERAKRRTRSQLAQIESDYNAKNSTYAIEKARLNNHVEQLSKTIIKAPQPGLVVYASSDDDHHGRERGLIAEGATVWERQNIIELPDLSKLKVKLHVHESLMDLVKVDQQAIITVEALPGLTLRGHVDELAILPDAGHRWMSPDLTVYIGYILIDDKSEDLMPGMTTTAEIIMADLRDVLYVPLSAVTVRQGREVCYVTDGSKRTATPVEVGLANENFIEIKSGLKEGDRVLAQAAIGYAQATGPGRPRTQRP
jgi:HlyD family secretion protein